MSSVIGDWCDLETVRHQNARSTPCFAGMGIVYSKESCKQTKNLHITIVISLADFWPPKDKQNAIQACRLYLNFIACIFPWFKYIEGKKDEVDSGGRAVHFVAGSTFPAPKNDEYHGGLRYAMLAPLFMARYADSMEHNSSVVQMLYNNKRLMDGEITSEEEVWNLITTELLDKPAVYSGGHGIYSTYDFDVIEGGKYSKMKFKTFDELKECVDSIISGKVQPKSVYKIFNK